MRVSTKGRYGLRALFELALYYGEGPILIKDIARRQGLSEAYLEQIFLSLKAAGLVKSVRGAYGGYLLAREPEKINLKEVLDILESNKQMVPCLENPDDCSLFKSCVLRDFWKNLKEAQTKIMKAVTLAELVKNRRMRQEELSPLVYNI